MLRSEGNQNSLNEIFLFLCNEETQEKKILPISKKYLENFLKIKSWHVREDTIVHLNFIDGAIQAEVIKNSNKYIIPSYFIHGIPKEMVETPELLSLYLADSYVRLTPTQEDEYVLRVYPRLRGGLHWGWWVVGAVVCVAVGGAIIIAMAPAAAAGPATAAATASAQAAAAGTTAATVAGAEVTALTVSTAGTVTTATSTASASALGGLMTASSTVTATATASATAATAVKISAPVVTHTVLGIGAGKVLIGAAVGTLMCAKQAYDEKHNAKVDSQLNNARGQAAHQAQANNAAVVEMTRQQQHQAVAQRQVIDQQVEVNNAQKEKINELEKKLDQEQRKKARQAAGEKVDIQPPMGVARQGEPTVEMAKLNGSMGQNDVKSSSAKGAPKPDMEKPNNGLRQRKKPPTILQTPAASTYPFLSAKKDTPADAKNQKMDMDKVKSTDGDKPRQPPSP